MRAGSGDPEGRATGADRAPRRRPRRTSPAAVAITVAILALVASQAIASPGSAPERAAAKPTAKAADVPQLGSCASAQRATARARRALKSAARNVRVARRRLARARGGLARARARRRLGQARRAYGRARRTLDSSTNAEAHACGPLYVQLGDSLGGYSSGLFPTYRTTLGVTNHVMLNRAGEDSASIITEGQLAEGLAWIGTPSDTRVVTIDIGGADAAFNSTGCENAWDSPTCPFRDNFDATLGALREALAADPGWELLVAMAYPNPYDGLGNEGVAAANLLGDNLMRDCADAGSDLGLNDVVSQVADQHQAPVADVYSAFEGNNQAFMSDALHWNEAGRQAAAQAFRDAAPPCATSMFPPPPAPPRCKGQPATLVGTPGPDAITGTPGRDVIVALAGDDRITTGAGNDLVCAGAGTDRIFGGAGGDRLFGEAGFDRVRGGSGPDSLFGGNGPDRLFGDAGADRLFGGAGSDQLSGLAGRPDRCIGGPARDVPRARGCEIRRSIP